MAKLVSKTYGDALFALAVEEHMVDQLYEEAQAVAQILRENTELTRLMNHPKIEKEEKVRLDRKSTRLNSSHECISYAVFC